MYIRGGKRDLSARSGRERERGRGQRVPPSTIRRPGVAFIHFTRVCYPRTSTIPMHPLGPASGVPIYRLREKIYDHRSPLHLLPLSLLSYLIFYKFLRDENNFESEERKTFSFLSFDNRSEFWRSMIEKRRGKMEEANRSRRNRSRWTNVVSGATMWRNRSMKFHRKTVGNRQQLEFEKSTPAVETGNRRV